MLTTIDLTIVCTVTDAFEVMRLARAEVESAKAQSEWESYYPASLTDAVQLLARTGVAAKFLRIPGINLHEIGHALRDVSFPPL